MNRVYLAIMAVTLVAGTVFLGASVAFGQTGVDIPDQVFRGDPGEVFHAGTIQAVAGDECVATLTYTNQQPKLSEHPNTDILVGPLTFSDVEHGAFMSVELIAFTATGPVDVALRLGGDGASSGGFHVEVTCNPPTTTTSTTTTSTTIAEPTVTTSIPSVTTTTEPAPEGPIDAGGGACADGACVIAVSGSLPWLIGGITAFWAAFLLLGWAWLHGSRDLDDDA